MDTERYELEELLKKAVAKWGKEVQLDQTIEECAELIQAIQKHRRRGEIRNLVELMIQQLKILLHLHETWNALKKEKIAYLRDKLGK